MSLPDSESLLELKHWAQSPWSVLWDLKKTPDVSTHSTNQINMINRNDTLTVKPSRWLKNAVKPHVLGPHTQIVGPKLQFKPLFKKPPFIWAREWEGP